MTLRESNIERLSQQDFDVLIVGGGINGATAAAALSGRGVRTALIEGGDFAGFTSQESSNLAWGGIKYLESFDFALVRKLCRSRNDLIRNYPSTVREIRFFTTLARGFRYPRVFLWLATWLYWFMGNCFTRMPRLLSKRDIAQEEPVVATGNAVGGFEYSDAYFHDNDARFVFNLVRTGLDHGCIAANYVTSVGAERDAEGFWVTQARDEVSGAELEIRSRVLINTTGPFADDHNRLTGRTTKHHHVYSKGVHLLVNRVSPNQRVLTFFSDDDRMFFVIPMGRRSCVGTTDTAVDDPHAEVTDDDRRFILDNINERLNLDPPLRLEDIIAERCGVRPLVVEANDGGKRDWVQLSRKHALDVDHESRHISVFGGKLTDCINVGNEICDAVASLGTTIPYPDYHWYGEPEASLRDEFLHRAELMDLDGFTSPLSSEPLTVRLWRRYGARALVLLEAIRANPRQAEVLIEGTEYIRCELKQAARVEMIVKLEDFLRRRSKIALVERREVILAAPGLREACEILFRDRAEAELAEYAASVTSPPGETPAPSARSESSSSAPAI